MPWSSMQSMVSGDENQISDGGERRGEGMPALAAVTIFILMRCPV